MKTFANFRRGAQAIALASLYSVGAVPAWAGSGNPLVDHVRTANDRFVDFSAAVAEGYAPIPCASGLQGGAMGIHYINGRYLKDGVVDIAHPEAVMYEPAADGKLKLISVEYVAFKGPAALEGHLFNVVSEPNRYGLDTFYELHVWAWKNNPAGSFADNNPDVSCDYMKSDGN